MAQNAENRTENQSTPSRATAPVSNLYRLGIVVLALLAVGSAVWWLVLPALKRASNAGSGTATVVLPLESFTVNLADSEEGRFLRVTMALGVEGQLPPLTKNGSTEGKAPEASAVSMATIRDSILTVLAQCTSDELLTPEGKSKLKRDLLAGLNRDVAPLGAREVYFSEFLVQR